MTRLPTAPYALPNALFGCLLLSAAAGCPETPPEPPPRPPILDVAERDAFQVGSLADEVHIVWTEYGVPHIYGSDRRDVALASGFVMARDRYFVLEMSRRLAQGSLSELLGDDALEMDMEARGQGMSDVTEALCEGMTDVETDLMAGYAEGINAYIDAMLAGALPPPSELELAGPLLGGIGPEAFATPWNLLDVCAAATTLVYELGFETTDLSLSSARQQLAGMDFGSDDLAELREAGAWADIWQDLAPTHLLASAYGREPDGPPASTSPPAPAGTGIRIEQGMLERAADRGERFELLLGRDSNSGFGSNAWAVSGSRTASGSPLLASDGHLPLTVPTLFYRLHLNTTLLGTGSAALDTIGIAAPGVPMVAVGHNGQVAWGQTQLSGDINDYFAEALTLDGSGRPASRLWQGSQEELIAVEESYQIADVPLLGSVGRTENITRWKTADGRLLYGVEGTPIGSPDEAPDGTTPINIVGEWIIPGDVDGDGVVSGITADYTALDGTHLIQALWGFNVARDVEDIRTSMRSLSAYSQNIVAADTGGNIFYAGFQATPCRDYLPRGTDGRFIEGADPQDLIDGTLYPSFEIPFTGGGMVDESATSPEQCTIPFDNFPQSLNPERGFVVTANNDPYGVSLDGDLWNDEYYMGGPWYEGWRAWRIEELLDSEDQTLDTTIAVQADHRSNLGGRFTGDLLAALDRAQSNWEAGAEEGSNGRAAAAYGASAEAIQQARAYLDGWEENGYQAESGVETFYHQPTAAEREDAVATMIFNAWFPRFVRAVFDDEALPSVFRPSGFSGRMKALHRFLGGRGPDNSQALASWNAATGESAFFDVRGTEEVEEADELMVVAFAEALSFLAGPSDGPGSGGFGSDDSTEWLWGMRHTLRFESLLADLLGDNPLIDVLVADFAIGPELVPPAPEAPSSDPRNQLSGFPRPGDNLGVDAANSGLNTNRFTYGSGPVMRFATELLPEQVEAVNVIPGGQSSLLDDPHHHDQVELWLGNEASQMAYTVDEVVGTALARDVLRP